MSNAWIIRPLPMVVTPRSTAGQTGQAAYLNNDYMGVIWAVPGTSMGGSGTDFFHYVDVDLGADIVVDTVLALGVSAPAAGVTGSFSVRASTEADGASFPAPWIGGVAPIVAGVEPLVNGDYTSLWSAPEFGTPPAARYLRLMWRATTRFDLRVRRIVIGRRIALDHNFVFGGAFGVRDFGTLDFSARGVMLRRRSVKQRSIGISFANAHRDEVEAQIAPLIELVGATDPIALITDPAADPMRIRRTYFGPMVGDLGTAQRNADGWEWRCNMVSLF